MTQHFVENIDPALSHYTFMGRDTSFKVFPQLGGSVQDWTYNEHPILVPFGHSERSLQFYREFCVNGVLFPFPNRLEHGLFSHEGEKYQLPINEPERNNAIHGFLNTRKFEVVQVKNDQISLCYHHRTNAEFQFDFSFEIKYRFSEMGMHLSYVVRNTGKLSFPFGMGWHPYFALENPNTATIHFQADKEYKVDHNLIPNGTVDYKKPFISLANTQLDTAYKLTSSKVILDTETYRLKMTVPYQNFLQLFIPSDRQSIAVEPMTCIANAFNNGNGVKTLAVGASFHWEVHVALEKK